MSYMPLASCPRATTGGREFITRRVSTVAAERWLTRVITRTQLRFEILTMRVQLRGLSGASSLNGQCGKVGGFEGERVFVKLDNSNRVVKVKTINVRKEGGNAASA